MPEQRRALAAFLDQGAAGGAFASRGGFAGICGRQRALHAIGAVRLGENDGMIAPQQPDLALEVAELRRRCDRQAAELLALRALVITRLGEPTDDGKDLVPIKLYVADTGISDSTVRRRSRLSPDDPRHVALVRRGGRTFIRAVD